jgi:hypothetical protein
MANRISRLKRNLRGMVLVNPPQTTAQRAWAESLGFHKQSTGDWVSRNGPPLNPSLAFLDKFGFGHICQACKSPFRSKKQRDQFCASCRLILEDHLAKCRRFIVPVLNAPSEQQRTARENLENYLTCRFPIKDGNGCGWTANKGRSEPSDLRLVLESLPDWVKAMYRHFIRHVFWNRFPYSRRFFPQNVSEEAREELREWAYSQATQKEMVALIGDSVGVEIKYPAEIENTTE